MAPNLLVLGGTTEATTLANTLGDRGIAGTFSYAGRVERPKRQPLPTRIGGFGGAEGLAQYLRDHHITHVIDATHPFAAQMSRNAVDACAACDIPLVAVTRAPWMAQPGDRWTTVPDIPAAVAALDGPKRRVMLAIGRMHLDQFSTAPDHFYLLRLVDPPEGDLPFADFHTVLSRGPFTVADDTDLMATHNIDLMVAKNAGGTGARAKIDAARTLNIPVVMIDRPTLPQRDELHSVADVLGWIAHSGTDRGV